MLFGIVGVEYKGAQTLGLMLPVQQFSSTILLLSKQWHGELSGKWRKCLLLQCLDPKETSRNNGGEFPKMDERY